MIGDHNPRVIEMSYKNDLLTITVQGHPTDALDLAHVISQKILSPHGAWRIVGIDYEQSVSDKDSEAILVVDASLKSAITPQLDPEWMSLEMFAGMRGHQGGPRSFKVWLGDEQIPYDALANDGAGAIRKTVAVRHLTGGAKLRLQREIVEGR